MREQDATDEREDEDNAESFEDDQAIGDYEINGPDQITWSDLQRQEAEEVESDYDDSYEDDDNRFAGLNSHGNDIFGRSGW